MYLISSVYLNELLLSFWKAVLIRMPVREREREKEKEREREREREPVRVDLCVKYHVMLMM